MTERLDQRDLIHYRDVDGTTWTDRQTFASTLRTVGWEAMYVWSRLIAGPENMRLSVSVEQFDPREFTETPLLPALRDLERIGAVEVHDGLITFPNLRPGRPPHARSTEREGA